jgi:hypothetical protein
MQPRKARYVTACQQLLALGAVLAVLTPAAAVISLDVVQETPHQQAVPGGRPAVGLSAYTRETQRPSKVPTAPVQPSVEEYPLTAPTGRKTAALGLVGRTKIGALGEPTTVTSVPQPVPGYGAVGVTWDRTRVVADDLAFQVRTRTGDAWTDWMELPYDADHGPDPQTQEAENSRPGTDVLLVGKVDQVQVRSTMDDRDAPPAGMRLAVVSPGKATRTARELPALDTADGSEAGGASVQQDGTEEGSGASMSLEAATFTPKPVIYSRAQWGANESLRDKSSLHYYEVHAGFVHHTVNANDYTRAEVPGIIRSIYAYHTQSRGWSDVGYNFLVDKFGRIWEGRFGGIDRPVVGAHTLGYNDYAFAMSAIGNYETKRPSEATVQAYGALFAWKLSLHGVDASSTKQWVGSRYFEAINGHRDADSTACPGKYLYAKIPQIREIAAATQKGWAGRELESNLASTPHPDLVVRRASDGQGFIIPTGGLIGFKRPSTATAAMAGNDDFVASPDLTGDGLGDLLVRGTDGVTRVRPGTGTGFGDPVKGLASFTGRDLVTPVGDLDEDGHNDVVARNASTGRLNVYLGGGAGGFERRRTPGDWTAYDALAATGDVDGDGHVDLFARDGDGLLWLFPGTGTRQLGAPVKVSAGWEKYTDITGYGDFTRDGVGDLVVRTDGGPGLVLPSRGDGTFGHQLGPVGRVQEGGGLSGADLGGDGVPDLVLRRGEDLALFANNGTFDTGAPIATGMDLSGVNVLLNAGDWDRDGFGDVVTRTKKGILQLRRGDGEGGFAEPLKLAGDFGAVRLLAAVGDMTGDGWPDLMGQPGTGAMRIYPGRGLEGLKASYVAHSRIDAGRQVAVGRWDGDGAPDSLFRSGDKLSLFPGNGPGGLTGSEGLGLDLKAYDWVVGLSDGNLTGHADVIVRERATGNLYLFRGTVKGFAPRRFIGEGAEVYDLVG